ncbi:MAG: glutamine--tRNA ligase [Deltaproteobacteria bacterium]|nr:MAG: glutamine--tRNA ligase [Deltaproteobacteria bacterium]
MTIDEKSIPTNFIRNIIDEDNKTGKYEGKVHTRFPPEPNGYLHIGHAKSICLNFGLATDYKGKCNLRFDDTNPVKEEAEYVKSIIEDITWLGFDWEERLYYASDYFEQMYDYAVQLIKKGSAYVDDQSAEEIRSNRGTLTQPGVDSPHRNRPVEENLEIFQDMRNGKFPDGSRVLRAKIDMTSSNLNMRDPVMYRILHADHHRTGDKWCIYPMYDSAHGLEDSIEGITHSICTLEFEDHRPLYDWFLEELEVYHPQQIEFARLSLNYTMMSKRNLLTLVKEGHVSGWDDPRMPTLSGLRRRGYTPEAIRDFSDRIGVSKSNSIVEFAMLDSCLREDLNRRATRMMAVLNPLKVVITDYPEGKEEVFKTDNNPEDPSAGTREVVFGREIYIDRDDFLEEAPRKWFRMAPGKEVRLKHAYYITCNEVIKDEKTGEVMELRCTHDPTSRGGWREDGPKVKGTLQWVSAKHGHKAEVRLYDQLFSVDNPNAVEEGGAFSDNLNPDSLKIISNALVEPALAEAKAGDFVQFLRIGYFCPDAKDHNPEKPVFNRTVTLRDTWARVQRSQEKK